MLAPPAAASAVVSARRRTPGAHGRNAGASLHFVHINSSAGDDIDAFLAGIQAARDAGQDVTTEAYPYGAGMTRIESALFDDWASWPEERYGLHRLVSILERIVNAYVYDRQLTTHVAGEHVDSGAAVQHVHDHLRGNLLRKGRHALIGNAVIARETEDPRAAEAGGTRVRR